MKHVSHCLLIAAFAGLAFSPLGLAQVCSFASARAEFAQLVQQQSLPGAGLLIGSREGILHESYLGNYTRSTVVPIASASKLLSGVRMLQLAERGALSLDAPVSSYLPQFTGLKGTMTVRQMFSHTSGFGDDSGSAIMFNSAITLAQAVDQIACCRPLNAGYSVGGQFSYGGVSMHIAGRVAEVVGGGDWQARWIAEISAPLGITSIDWQGLGTTQNYGIAGSARSNLRDYGQVLHMLTNAGRSNNTRILRASSVAVLKQDQVGTLPIAYSPINAGSIIKYGVGSWLEPNRPVNQAALIHSLGAFGFFPWVDFERGLFGIFMLRGGAGINSAAYPSYLRMLSDIASEADSLNCGLVDSFDEILNAGFEAN